jgi:hypothetical protein
MRKKVEKKFYRKKGEVHIDKEWDLYYGSSNSDDEGLSIIAFNKSSLFPKVHHTCLMAKEKKVFCREPRKYTTSSGDEEDYSNLFKGLDRYKFD